MSARTQGWRVAIKLLALGLIVACAGPTLAVGSPGEKLFFAIDAGDAATRLNEFGATVSLQLLFDFRAAQGLVTHPASGEMTPVEALEKMIAGTGLAYEFVNDHTITLTVRNAPTVDGPTSARKRSLARRSPNARDPADRRALDAALEQVTVRGTNAPPSLPVGMTLLNLTRADIDATNFVTVQSVVHTLPQVFGGGPSEDTREIGFEAQTNNARGSGVNLRGLGAGSTLVLMNGRRLAGGGSEGIFVDVSNLPLAAVERMDILPDNSSTVYGADAVGGVVNFVMRDHFVGGQTEAHFGTATRGQLNENYVSQLIGGETDTMRGMLAIDFYSRDSLSASSRAQARSDLRAFGGDNFDVIQSNPGTIVIGSQTWAIPHDQDGTALNPDSLVAGTRNLQNKFDSTDILPSQQRWSVFGTGRKQLNDSTSLFADVLFAQRDVRGESAAASGFVRVPNTNPYYVNPTGGTAPLLVAYSFIDEFGPSTLSARVNAGNFATGLDVNAGESWRITGTVSYATERMRVEFDNLVDSTALFAAAADADPATAFNPFGDGAHTNPATLAAIRSDALFTTSSNVKSLNLSGTGVIAQLAGGDVKLALGAERRLQSFESESLAQGASAIVRNNLGRSVTATFAEVRLPFVGKDNRRTGIERFELSLSGRYENYSDFGHMIVPRYGFTWAPWTSVALRGTWSHSFRPPNLADLDEGRNATTFLVLPDPTAPGGRSNVLVWSGKNAALQQERAKSWTLGLDLEPNRFPGLSFALTYFNIDFTDRMHAPEPSGDLLINSAYSDLITRNPTAAERADVCSRAPISALPGACLTAPIDAIADLRVRNDASVQTRGLDLIGRYQRETSLGTIRMGLNGTYILNFAVANSRSLPRVDLVSTQNNPVNLRLRGSVGLKRGGIDANAFATFANSYRDTASAPARHVTSWTTLDLNLAYTLAPDARAWLGQTTFALGVENLFDKDPPFLNNHIGVGYDQENADLTGRIVSFRVRKTW